MFHIYFTHLLFSIQHNVTYYVESTSLISCVKSYSFLPLQITRRDQFDQIVIETTGLANPVPIINTLMVHDDLVDNIRLDGVVTLVDAKHVEQHLDDKEKSEGAVNEAVEQIAYADRILLNKVDLVSPLRTSPPPPG